MGLLFALLLIGIPVAAAAIELMVDNGMIYRPPVDDDVPRIVRTGTPATSQVP